ncbi:unnamed protein product, partial [Rotaria magnacalcarata]
VRRFHAVLLINWRADREYYDLLFCSAAGCTATFESNIELSAHIAANLHVIVDDVPRTTNDIARIHLTEIRRSTSTRSRSETEAILQHQMLLYTMYQDLFIIDSFRSVVGHRVLANLVNQ